MSTEAKYIKDKINKPKFSSRKKNRCELCGRPRGYMRKYNLCRLCFRERANRGEIPGIRKASW